jgi:hypothetical protein
VIVHVVAVAALTIVNCSTSWVPVEMCTQDLLLFSLRLYVTDFHAYIFSLGVTRPFC